MGYGAGTSGTRGRESGAQPRPTPGLLLGYNRRSGLCSCEMRMRWSRGSGLLTALLMAVAAGCPSSPPGESSHPPPARAAGAQTAHRDSVQSAAIRDLDKDEARGGHTLSRHVGLTDADLVARLAREPAIAAASTYVDRATAERTVAAALAADVSRLEPWTRRTGRRPNLALRFRGQPGRPIGRVARRGDRNVRSCHDAVVVLKWDEGRDDFFVLTSYPEIRP